MTSTEVGITIFTQILDKMGYDIGIRFFIDVPFYSRL